MSGGFIFPDPDLPDEMLNATIQPPAVLLPLMFVQPVTGLPLGIECGNHQDEEGRHWVVMRIETVQGSTVIFLHPDTGDNLAADLTKYAGIARHPSNNHS